MRKKLTVLFTAILLIGLVIVVVWVGNLPFTTDENRAASQYGVHDAQQYPLRFTNETSRDKLETLGIFKSIEKNGDIVITFEILQSENTFYTDVALIPDENITVLVLDGVSGSISFDFDDRETYRKGKTELRTLLEESQVTIAISPSQADKIKLARPL